MAEFTKGKWGVGSFNDEPFARSLLSVYREDGEAIIMAMTPRLMAFGEAQANAHLVAAAPDMYEALKAMADTSSPVSPKQAHEMAVIALAKAEGKV